MVSVIKMGERVLKKGRKERYVTQSMFGKVMGVSDFCGFSLQTYHSVQ